MALRHACAARRGGLLPPAVGVALTFAAGLELSAACSDRPGVLQPPTPPAGGWTAFLSEWSVLGGPADNYNCDRAIDAVTWWGFLDDLGGDFNPKSFRLTFHSAVGVLSLPGAIEHVYDVVVAPQASFRGC